MALPISANENATGAAASADLETIMTTGATVGVTQVIPPTAGYVPAYAPATDFFKAMAIVIGRRGAGGAYLNAFNNTAHSILANNVQTIVNYNAAVEDSVGGLTPGASWKWVPGAAGLYHVEAMLQISGPSGIGVTGRAQCDLILYRVDNAGGESLDSYIGTAPITDPDLNFIKGSQLIKISNTTDGIRLKARQGTSQQQFITSIGGGAQTNYIRIFRAGSV